MKQMNFVSTRGSFVLRNAQRHSNVYFPLVNEGGMISSVTPLLAGDCKTDQNTFLLAPASSETLHESRSTRNFWVCMDGYAPWSATGQSALQQAARFTDAEEETILSAGMLWQRLSKTHSASGLCAEILSFVPAGSQRIEIMQVTLSNRGEKNIHLHSAAAIPLYGRSADNIRDHRHVTSLLHRVTLSRYGLDLHPTLTFDERGHKKGEVTYRVWGSEENGRPPIGFIPCVQDFIGSGSYDWPESIVKADQARLLSPGDSAAGEEMIAALYFENKTLLPGECVHYQIILSIDDDPSPFLCADAVDAALAQTEAWWENVSSIAVQTGSEEFDSWLRWVGIQPVLRRICGCSFLPHHDYGRGGRGWRDLWQDSLALLLRDPGQTQQDLLQYFAGVRTDGTNATIIGSKPGEFKADRNNIPRVWMDHSFWPLHTVELYLNETGDNAFLLERQPYFRDTLAHRGEGSPLPTPGTPKVGTVLEHLLIQTVTAFFDVGEHGNIRLRGADWNDGLDMARNRGESVAFTAAYAGNLITLANRLKPLPATEVILCEPLYQLMRVTDRDPAVMNRALYEYCQAMECDTGSVSVKIGELSGILVDMGSYLMEHIRRQEWVTDGCGNHWFNSYYDDHARQVEGVHEDHIRMMLTGQVFALLSGTASDQQAAEIIAAADRYLCDPTRGGYCLNTDFREVKTDMGRMFGFAYGTKENGAVFCHMAVMYAYALYHRGFYQEGWRVLEMLFRQCMAFDRSRTLPGIPEYFDLKGKGMYPYLTGSASWLLLTVQTQLFGIRGSNGDLMLEPKLLACHFGENGIARIRCCSAGSSLTVRYHAPKYFDAGYEISGVYCEETGELLPLRGCAVVIPRGALPENATLDITLTEKA